MKYQKTAAILALVGTLASLPAKAECYQVTTDQNGQPLYRCDQTVQQVATPVIGQPVQQQTNNGTGDFIGGALIGAVAGAVLANAFDNDRRVTVNNYGSVRDYRQHGYPHREFRRYY